VSAMLLAPVANAATSASLEMVFMRKLSLCVGPLTSVARRDAIWSVVHTFKQAVRIPRLQISPLQISG